MTSRNKFAVLATRSADSVCGFAQRWYKEGGNVLLFDTLAGAENYADMTTQNMSSPNLTYQAKEYK